MDIIESLNMFIETVITFIRNNVRLYVYSTVYAKSKPNI